jgi:hypothetical protein
LSQTQRQAANEWYDHTLYSRLNDKLTGAIVPIMPVVREPALGRGPKDDPAGHVLAQEPWEVVPIPANADDDELHRVETVFGRQSFGRKAREAYAAFGNSTGDREMLEWTGAGSGARLKMLVLHDDAAREYAYGPALGLPDSRVGAFTQALYDEASKDGWTVISMKNDWKRIFAFE